MVALEIHGGSKRKDRPAGGFYVREMPTSKPLDTGGLNPNCAQGGAVVFQPRYYTRDNKPGGRPQGTADITNCHKAGDSAPVVAFDWQAGGGSNDTSFRGKSRSYVVRKGEYAQIRKNAHDAVAGQFGVRRLTPRECERLQGFPDDWTAVNGMSDSARYRMLGNAVAVPVVEWIGRRIVEVEAL